MRFSPVTTIITTTTITTGNGAG
ncbi:thr operon leader peptide [Entomohabitans teleogrylli]|nr:thr operon leader peptide [Entomohabitans teleogrylli]